MIETIRPVRYGILLGLLGLLFGIGWAFYLVLGHERIHESLDRAYENKEEYSLIRFLEPSYALAHTHEKPKRKETVPMHEEEGGHHVMEEEGHQEATGAHQHGVEMGKEAHLHDSPIMELSHTRLRRGHIHAMGLGTLTILLSLVIAFTSAPDKVKTAVSVFTGIGGIIYPLAWIIMGYRTPALGPDAADVSVRFIAGPGIALVCLGIFTATVYLLKDAFSEKSL